MVWILFFFSWKEEVKNTVFFSKLNQVRLYYLEQLPDWILVSNKQFLTWDHTKLYKYFISFLIFFKTKFNIFFNQLELYFS